MARLIQILFFLWIINLIAFNQQTGKLVFENIDAPSLAGSIIGEPETQPIAVYLPPSYDAETEKRYPVVYYLPGYGGRVQDCNKGFHGYFLDRSMNSNITQGRCKEVIMVVANGYNLLEGSFFYNSPVTGNWEDFIVADIVNYMDENYRTIPSSASRALLGFSMGGYGSLHLSMKHPSVFSIGIGECAGLADTLGMMKTSLFDDDNVINRIISIRNELSKYSMEEAHQKYLDTIQYYKNRNDWITMFSFAYGSAFAPNTETKAPYFDYPFSKDSNNVMVRDDEVFALYEEGFGNLDEKIQKYKDSLTILKGYVIDYGINDYFKWINEGSIYYHELLSRYEIPHQIWENNGGHGDLHKQRTENYYLPFCDTIFVFDENHLSSEAFIEYFSCNEQVGETKIDKEKKIITIGFYSNKDISSVKPTIYLSPGAKISPKIGASIDFTSGIKEFIVTAENGIDTVKWTVNVEKISYVNNSYKQKQPLQLYPNPSNDGLFLESDKVIIEKVEIVGICGRVITRKTINKNKVLMERDYIPSGLYFVKAYVNDKCYTFKVILM